MDFRQIKAFVDVAGSGSYARAAALTGTAQSGLSRQVSALERTVGAPLFHRTGRGVALTELGERLLPRARALVGDALSWENAAQNDRSEPRGEVTLGVVPVASRSLMAALVTDLRQLYPGIRLRAMEGYSGQVEEWLASGRVEIGIYNRYRRGNVANAEALWKADVHVIARRDHPLIRDSEITFRALADLALTVPIEPNSLTATMIGLAASQHRQLDICLEAGSTPLIRDVMLTSDLVTVSAKQVYASDLQAGTLAATPLVKPRIQQTTWMSMNGQRPPSRQAGIVVAHIRKLAARHRKLQAERPGHL